MYDSEKCQELIDLLISPIQLESLSVLEDNVSTLKEHHQLAFAMLADTIQEATRVLSEPTIKAREAKIHRIIETIKLNVNSLALWEQANNRTVEVLEAGHIRPETLKPHVRLSSEKYDEFYSNQSAKFSNMAVDSDLNSSGESFYNDNSTLSHNINHAFRVSYGVYLIEVLFGLLSTKNSEQAIRWLDIGCGFGQIINSVDPKRYGCQNWEITGCDMQEGKIKFANQLKLPDRQFFTKEAFSLLSEMSTQNNPYDIISMFEFMEHLNDPLSFLEQLAGFRSEVILIASPLAQTIGKPLMRKPDPVHLWSFSREGLEDMLKIAGLDVIYSSEVRVGSYIGGLDWLTVVCGDKELFKEKRTNWRRF